ncbi:hypothetical protein [Tropicibacter sp. S64]|uniref:hypothetical protein n=1 Tax=Tropicibacter sp. S64 TaxID=3415122 RepID=UPI003C7A61DE
MDRRRFILTAGAMTSAGTQALCAYLPAPPPAPPLMALLAASVRADFGPGFSVCAADITGALTRATIENHGNRYVIERTGTADWIIRHSSDL